MLWFSPGAGGAEHARPRAGSISECQEAEGGQKSGACEDKCHGAKGESLSPQEGQSSQLRGKDMSSDGWQKAIVTVGNGREYAAPHWGLVAPGMSDRRKEGKAQICKMCVHTGERQIESQQGHRQRDKDTVTCPEPPSLPLANRHTGQVCPAEQHRATLSSDRRKEAVAHTADHALPLWRNSQPSN